MSKVKRRTLVGKVVSAKCDKSRVALIDSLVSHKLYKGTVRLKKKIMFHDDKNESGLNDVVEIVECKPISACKRWCLFRVVKKQSV